MTIRASSQQQWHHEIAKSKEPIDNDETLMEAINYGARSDEILEEEYDSSELFDEDELEFEPLLSEDLKSPNMQIEDKIPALQQPEKEDEDETIDILSAFGLAPGLPTLPGRNEKGTFDKEAEQQAEVDPEVSPSPTSQQPSNWQRYPQLLAPRTPPGKRVIVSEEHPAANPKAVDNHRVSYGLTAASVYARLQPSLRPRNGTGGPRQKLIPRPYKRRPITLTTTTGLPMSNNNSESLHEAEDDPLDMHLITEKAQFENEPIDMIEDQEQEQEVSVINQQLDNVLKAKEIVEKETQEEEKSLPEAPIIHQTDEELEKEQTSLNKSLVDDPSVVENETLKPKTFPPATDNNPTDIKALLRSAGPLSLSEILQQKGMSLAELLKGGSRVAPVIGITTTPSSPQSSVTNAHKLPTNTTEEHASTSTTIPSITATTRTTGAPIRPDVLPTVKPISLRELLAAKNMSLQEIVQPTIRSTTSTEKPQLGAVSATLKPGVKLPTRFTAGRGKGLGGLVAQSAPAEVSTTESTTSTTHSSLPSKPLNPKPISELKPLIFGGARPVEAEPTTSIPTTKTTPRQMVIHSKRPYVAGSNVGEYGTHLGRSYEEDEDDEENNGTRSLSSNMIGSYGMQRPIATSRLTPPPPRKQRPVLNFNYNALSEEEEEDDGTEPTTLAPILTHFNEEELSESHPYFDLPVSVRNAIIVSSTIGGFCLVVFIVILVVFRIKQKTRIRLRHPAALLGLGGVIDTTASNGSDSSGITTPVSHPASKSGYAKLPRRSSSLWGTLRRSVRQMESVHYS